MAYCTDCKQLSLFDCCAVKKRTEPALNSASGSSSTDPQLARTKTSWSGKDVTDVQGIRLCGRQDNTHNSVFIENSTGSTTIIVNVSTVAQYSNDDPTLGTNSASDDDCVADPESRCMPIRWQGELPPPIATSFRISIIHKKL